MEALAVKVAKEDKDAADKQHREDKVKEWKESVKQDDELMKFAG